MQGTASLLHQRTAQAVLNSQRYRARRGGATLCHMLTHTSTLLAVQVGRASTAPTLLHALTQLHKHHTALDTYKPCFPFAFPHPYGWCIVVRLFPVYHAVHVLAVQH